MVSNVHTINQLGIINLLIMKQFLIQIMIRMDLKVIISLLQIQMWSMTLLLPILYSLTFEMEFQVLLV
jgi:hypothetical protein